MWRLDRARITLWATAGLAVAGLGVWLGLAALHRDDSAPAFEPSTSAIAEDGRARAKEKREVSDDERVRMLQRAHIWQTPAQPIARASLAGVTLDEVSCRFKISTLGGTTPKFDCELPDGEEIRIKYGNGPEVPAEAAATRLLRALGFAADDISIVEKLRCFGCPEEPFSMMKAVEITKAEGLYKQVVNFADYEDFDWVGLERKFNAWPVETETLEGWSFFELDVIEPDQGGAPRAHVDALRLIALLLAHWDNKSENQRLVCLSREWPEGSACTQPFLVLQDVGATFGPAKLDFAAWEQAPIWEDRSRCSDTCLLAAPRSARRTSRKMAAASLVTCCRSLPRPNCASSSRMHGSPRSGACSLPARE
jgi:hypothetical protein